jgi:hypothetical protein
MSWQSTREKRGLQRFASKTVVTVEGLEEVLRDMARLPTKAITAGRKAMLKITDPMAKRAEQLAPDDPETPGLLASTCRSIRPTVKKTSLRVMGGIVAGGKKLEARLGSRKYSAWALVQHEDGTLKHSKGQAKFLEIPFMSGLKKAPAQFRAEIDAEMRRA